MEIFGDTYRLKTDNDAEYIKQLSQMVDKRMRDISQKTRSFTGARAGVLAALEFADEYCQLKKDYDALMKLVTVQEKATDGFSAGTKSIRGDS